MNRIAESIANYPCGPFGHVYESSSISTQMTANGRPIEPRRSFKSCRACNRTVAGNDTCVFCDQPMHREMPILSEWGEGGTAAVCSVCWIALINGPQSETAGWMPDTCEHQWSEWEEFTRFGFAPAGEEPPMAYESSSCSRCHHYRFRYVQS